jgi:hypothetical protein
MPGENARPNIAINIRTGAGIRKLCMINLLKDRVNRIITDLPLSGKILGKKY